MTVDVAVVVEAAIVKRAPHLLLPACLPALRFRSPRTCARDCWRASCIA